MALSGSPALREKNTVDLTIYKAGVIMILCTDKTYV